MLKAVQYVRPPSVALNSVTVGSDPVSLTSDGLTVSFDLSIRLGHQYVLDEYEFDAQLCSVSNPNWFDANFKEITATARYPGNNTNTFGGGTLYNLDFKGYTQSTFNFPFTLKYVCTRKVHLLITQLHARQRP